VKFIATFGMMLALAACKSPAPANPVYFVGCYYSNAQKLPFVKITASSFQIPDLNYSDNDIKFERIKDRNLIWLSKPYGLENLRGRLQFKNLAEYTKADGLNYQITADGLLLIAPFPVGAYVSFSKGRCG
jgi:hypothetical protein